MILELTMLLGIFEMGVAELGDLQFRVLDSASLEAEASSGSVLSSTAAMTRLFFIILPSGFC